MRSNGHKKLCFVVQRYGEEICGGAEAHCMQYVQRLRHSYDITVLTSCALDYNTWKNEYPAGECEVGGVRVIRFESIRERDWAATAGLSPAVIETPYHDVQTALAWLKSIGPECPEMIWYVLDHKDEYDLFLFMGYMYYTTTFVLPYVAEKAVLLPTAHDEDALNKCNYFKTQFNLPRGLVVSTQEEIDLLHARFANGHIPYTVCGVGVQLPPPGEIAAVDVKGKFGLGGPYAVYVGRVDETKNCDQLISQFAYYKQKYGGGVKLVMVGEKKMDVPQDILCTGFVTDAEKFALILNAKVLILPSWAESLSMVTLEAMACGVPVLLRAQSAVLRAHIEKSNAGLYYYEKEDFAAALHYILSNEGAALKMGENGIGYVKEKYSWPVITNRLQVFIDEIIERNYKIV